MIIFYTVYDIIWSSFNDHIYHGHLRSSSCQGKVCQAQFETLRQALALSGATAAQSLADAPLHVTLRS